MEDNQKVVKYAIFIKTSTHKFYHFQEINEADKEKFLNECKRCAQECTSSDDELFNGIKKLRTEFL